MAYVANELFSQDFVSTDYVIISHNLDKEILSAKLIVNNEVRQDLITFIIVDSLDPRNRLAIQLESTQTGTVQIIETDFVAIGQLSATQMDSIGLSDVFVLGEEYDYAESLAESSTTSTTPVSKVTLNTASLPAGDYRIGWNFTWRHDDTSTDFIGEIQVDSSPAYTMRQEPKSSASTERYQAHGFVEQSLSAATHTIEIMYATSNALDTSFISQARLEIWRVQ